MKIAVYTIVKNEEKFIERWANSCYDADYRLIVDTGSIDRTVKVAQEMGCTTASISIDPWRFDDARNAALDLLPDDIDWCVSLDADELLVEGWREHLEQLPDNVTRPRYKYVWSWNQDGSEGLVFYRDHIHRRHGYRWKHPVHEILVCDGVEIQAPCGVVVHHYPDPNKSRAQYLPLLELAVQEDPEGDRNLFYLGRELMFHNRYEDAVPHFLKHLEISKWDAERSASMRYLARVTDKKEHWLLRACAEAPNRREPWVELARHYYESENWSQCYSASKRAVGITEKPLDYICEADSWGSLPHDLLSIASWNLGLLSESLEQAKTAFYINPYETRLRSNVASIMRSKRQSKVDVIIPTKSNMVGLQQICSMAAADASVETIYVVADGDDAFEKIKQASLPTVQVIVSPLSAGIHKMWNSALSLVKPGNHVCFLNDDVTIEKNAIGTLAGQLDDEPSIGLICPNYDNRQVPGLFQDVQGANGWYGKTGISGATMMLNSDLVQKWRFDDRMTWYFGDDDLALWTLTTMNRRTVVSGLTKSWGNDSWTTKNDPPANFEQVVNVDKVIFDEKWKSRASSRT
jgi:glycosyltransferase involved in cell wall biosynthesis